MLHKINTNGISTFLPIFVYKQPIRDPIKFTNYK